MSDWKSFNIYYYDNQDVLINKCISPLISRLKESIKDYFYIRYWLGGPHIRLRIKFINPSEEIINEVLYSIRGFLKDVPSSVKLDSQKYLVKSKEMVKKQKENICPNEALVPNNTVIIVKYEQELNKYFGDKGVLLAEKQFQYSTDLALNFLEKKPNKNQKVLFSLQYIISILKCHRTFMELKASREFLSNYLNYWKEFNDIKDEKVSLWKNNISVSNEFTIIREKIKCNPILDSDFACFHKVLLKKIEFNYGESAVYSFLFNFIHLFHNRIGITPLEEVFISLYGSLLFELGDDNI